jgi:ribonuclease HI
LSSLSEGIARPWNPSKGAYHIHGSVIFRLEDVGPTSLRETQTSNRAELRALVARLNCFRKRYDDLESKKPEEYAKLVVATDSTYVVDGAIM